MKAISVVLLTILMGTVHSFAQLTPVNDLCTNATLIGVNSILIGDATGATNDWSVAPNCSSNFADEESGSVGVWYRLEGNGETITVSTCGPNTTFNTSLSVFTGSCTTSLVCLVGNEDSGISGDCGLDGFQSRLEFNTVLDTDYYILVDGFGSSSGEFDLVTSSAPSLAVPANDNCSTAESLVVFADDDGTATVGDNRGATGNKGIVSCDEFSTINDVWYTFNSGTNVEVNVEVELTGLEAAGFIFFNMYEGCGNQVFEDNCFYNGLFSFEVTPNTDYVLQLWNSYETAGTYSVLVYDGPNSAITVLSETVDISKYDSTGFIVQEVEVVESEGHDILFEITDGNAENVFSIDEYTGEITVLSQGRLSNTSTTSFDLTVEVTDLGPGEFSNTGVVTVNVVDNRYPSVEDRIVSIDEYTENSTVVLNVNATDSDDDELSYNIIGGSGYYLFDIDEVGDVTVIEEDFLDFETAQSLELLVEVTDDGPLNLVSEATILINLNDINEEPIVPDVVHFLSQYAADNYTIGEVEFTPLDVDQEHTFAITAGNTNSIFAIDQNTGDLTVASATNLLAGGDITYDLTIEVTDNGSPQLTGSGTVTIEVFDNHVPIITSSATFFVDENLPANSVVATITATDDDLDNISFTKVLGDELGVFSVGFNGEISVFSENGLDFETNPSFTLVVAAIDDGDGNLYALQEIEVILEDINEAPYAQDFVSDLSSYSQNGLLVGNLEAFDPEDDALSYEIVDGNEDGAFSISTSGNLLITDASVFDPVTIPTYELEIEISDDEFSYTSYWDVNLFLNEFPSLTAQPLFVFENSEIGDLVGTLVSVDEHLVDYDIFDEEETLIVPLLALAEEEEGMPFYINSETGELMVNTTSLDYEETQEYTLDVLLTDRGAGTLQIIETVSVRVRDVNEYSPEIDELEEVSIDEDIAQGEIIATISASDDDTFQTFSYEIVSGDSDIFSIDEEGVVTVMDSTLIDFETDRSLSITIEVTDSGSPSMTTEEDLEIDVNDVNEAPIFTELEDQTVTETFELTFTAPAVDFDSDNTLTFSLDTESIANGMSIDASTGVFSWTPSSDQSGSYDVEIFASDGELESSLVVTIIVDNILDVDNLQSGINIYPNPGRSNLFVQTTETMDVFIKNLDGKVLKTSTSNKEINIGGLSSGIYLIQLRDQSGLSVYKRFIKE